MSISIDVPHITNREASPSVKQGLASRAFSLLKRNTEPVEPQAQELPSQPTLLEASRGEIDELFDRIKAAQDELRMLKPGDKREEELSNLILGLQKRERKLFDKLQQTFQSQSGAE